MRDCAGSTAQSGRQRLKAVNASLLALGRVVSALVSSHGHVPYRDSALTRLLASALGTNARTALVACVAPTADTAEETMSTLTFAAKALFADKLPSLQNNKLQF